MILIIISTVRNENILSFDYTSIGGLIAFQSFVNMGVATRLLPNTGLPLPFVSYGLSSLLSMMIGMGFVFNVGLHRKQNT